MAEVHPVDEAVQEVEGEEEVVAQPEQEAENVKRLPTPDMPTRSEMLDHRCTHVPYRAWCPHCVEGRGREFGHFGCQSREGRSVPTVSFDYCFIGDKGEISNQDEADVEPGSIKVLVVRDNKSKALFSHVVPVKGVDEGGFAVKAITDDITWLGYSKLVVKTDNEPAILKLLLESLRALRIEGVEQVMRENSPEYDPQANGNAEIGVKLLKGMVRTMRSSLEQDLGFRVPARHPVVAWLVRHAASTMNWMVKGHDGMTAYQRVRGKPFTTRLLTFGEQVRFKLRAHEPLSATGDGRRTHLGTYIGIDRRTGQYMIHRGDGVEYARTLFRLPEANKWDKEALAKIKATPWTMHVPSDPEVVFKEKKDSVEQPTPDRVIVARQPYLKASDFAQWGLTRGCPKCDHEIEYGPGRTSRPHSQACKNRIVSELAKTAEGQARIAAANERLDRATRELGEKYRTDVAQGENAGVEQHQNQDPPEISEQIEFVPMEPEVHEREHVSREVPPPADEAGGAETHEDALAEFADGAVWHPGQPMEAGGGDPGMDIDVVETPEVELLELLNVVTRDVHDELKQNEKDIIGVVRAMGGCPNKYRRERRAALRAVVSEIYSPPRVTAAAKLLPELKIIPGFALDLTTTDSDGRHWDFDDKTMRDRALQRVREERPLLLVGSPMCTAFSTWQRVNNAFRDPVVVAGEMARARKHLEFCVELYREQIRGGRYFLHEHPAYASSWQTDIFEGIMS